MYINCICGEICVLKFETKLGRIANQYIRVLSVPVYCCVGCNESFMKGDDSLQFSKLVNYGIKLSYDIVKFTNNVDNI